jgi:hypothetical protein
VLLSWLCTEAFLLSYPQYNTQFQLSDSYKT